jgi:hypothetical protein
VGCSGYGLAFWLVVLAIISGAGAAIKAVSNPDWYFNRRVQAGMDVDVINSGKDIRLLVITKVVLIVPMLVLAWYLGGKAGYF